MGNKITMPPMLGGIKTRTLAGGCSGGPPVFVEFPWQRTHQRRLHEAVYRAETSQPRESELVFQARSNPILITFASDSGSPASLFEPITTRSMLDQPQDAVRVDLDAKEASALAREKELRNAASAELAKKIPRDDEAWRGLNSLRHTLIEKEMSDGLLPVEKAILGTIELVSDHRIHQANRRSLTKAKALLAKLRGDSEQ